LHGKCVTEAIGFAISVAVGGSLTMMVTVTGWLSAPPPAHVSENVVSPPSIPVLRVPLGAKGALHPPEAVQEVALAEDQVSVAEPPASIAPTRPRIRRARRLAA
jgi:hypothetical protein